MFGASFLKLVSLATLPQRLKATYLIWDVLGILWVINFLLVYIKHDPRSWLLPRSLRDLVAVLYFLELYFEPKQKMSGTY